jgi:hypothetical protein
MRVGDASFRRTWRDRFAAAIVAVEGQRINDGKVYLDEGAALGGPER